ncbi:MAG: TIGR04211 family SH3 domain-containing protein [Desulfobacteraceae bacterium]
MSSSCYAKTQYISDVLVITLRKDQNLQSEIIGYLKSDEPVKIIAENETLAQIENRKGLVGWVKKKFLIPGPTKKQIIEELRKENTDLKEKIKKISAAKPDNNASIEQSSSDHLQQITALKQNAVQSKALMAEADKELANLIKEIAALRTKNKEIADQLQKVVVIKPGSPESVQLPLSRKNGTKKDFSWPKKENIIWFLAGGAIMLFGFIVGIFSRRRKAYYY